MKPLKILIFSLSMLLLQACSSSMNSSPDGHVALGQSAQVEIPRILFRGQIVIGPQTSSFTPCNSNQQFLLTLSAQQYQTLSQQVASPYQSIYGEVIGVLTAPSQTGYNADFRARLIAKQINYISQDAVKGCSQPLQNTAAQGENPHWRVHMASPDTLDVTFGKSAPQQWPVKLVNHTEEQRVYTAPQGTLKLSPSLCQVNHQALYGWMATFNTQKGRYRGCARLGNQDPSTSWVATYHATSTRQDNFSVTLRLKADHTAETLYRYQNDPVPIVETGFWQVLNADQIQVVMTQHQQQYLLSQRIFTRQGNRLHAPKEQVGQQIYDISEGGLTLFWSQP
ncbi:hypothetical protein VR7878_01699 [Vibrio ruber DSM 16370]|uniref:Lipoprotein n=1 Tax=Vibrio ruber (strain DSM 16370 / JCM 11486 / BCRC 17186 / CECT 7878 / LMG 23124 / VR1) TaxID=1123498 RepID=A0A1R4LIM2_VIBR1|nr:hypothetical protein [Vibrio ruber]SJN56289.1 hypothetical protein VR7878_01699 [Vibrio ruber DSM 16370]